MTSNEFFRNCVVCLLLTAATSVIAIAMCGLNPLNQWQAVVAASMVITCLFQSRDFNSVEFEKPRFKKIK